MAFAGKCVLLDDSGSSHLWIVITDGAGTPPQIIMVNVSSWRFGIDDTCVLQPNDHPFMIRKSVVLYQHACLFAERMVPTILRNGIYQPDISSDVLQRICRGLCESPNTPKKIKDFYERYHDHA